MNTQQYTEIWDTLSADIKAKLIEFDAAVQEQGIGRIVADPVTLETFSDEFYGSLIYRLPGVSIPAVCVSLVLVESDDDENVLGIKLSIESFKNSQYGADFNSPDFYDYTLAANAGDDMVEELKGIVGRVVSSHSVQQAWRYVNEWARMDPLQQELTRRLALGYRPVTVQAMETALKELGYRLDRSGDCQSNTRWMSGEMEGLTYPAINTSVVQIDSSLSFAHVSARRDENFKKLQELRSNQSLFAVVKGRILEI